jgi:uncharacterized protein (DUF2461 family)
MNDELNGRRLFARRNPNEPYAMWRAPDSTLAAFGGGIRDPFAHFNTVSDAIAETAEIVNVNDQLLWLVDGRPHVVTGAVLTEISTRHLALKRLINRGTENEPNLVAEFVPYTPNHYTIRALLSGERREGGLLPRVTKV